MIARIYFYVILGRNTLKISLKVNIKFLGPPLFLIGQMRAGERKE
jgi:hypothetical protein